MNQAENKSIILRTLEEWEDEERQRRKMSAEMGLAMAELVREEGSACRGTENSNFCLVLILGCQRVREGSACLHVLALLQGQGWLCRRLLC